jgi:anti-sigma-K factor RskA
MVHDNYKEMIPAQALSALDPREERELSEHLAECGECRRDLAEWEATAASLALTADPIEPSPKVREAILQRLQSPKTPVTVLASRSPWMAIAAIVIFAALLITVIVLWQQNRRLRHENQVAQFISSPGKTQVRELKGTSEAPGASAKVLIDWQGHALLIVNGLPTPPKGKEYQLWFIEPKHPPKPGKTFSTDNTGKGLLEEPVAEVDRDSAVFAVTLEPAGGVAAPTGAIYLRSDL